MRRAPKTALGPGADRLRSHRRPDCCSVPTRPPHLEPQQMNLGLAFSDALICLCQAPVYSCVHAVLVSMSRAGGCTAAGRCEHWGLITCDLLLFFLLLCVLSAIERPAGLRAAERANVLYPLQQI